MTYTPDMPTNRDDVIDSRDVIHWIDALSGGDWKVGLSDDDAEALEALIALRDEAEGSPDWEYGETLIRDPLGLRRRSIPRRRLLVRR